MNVTLKQLRGFVAIAETGSFAEACERLHVSQPALSVSIRNFEGTIGGSLFARTTRAVELTPEGAQFLPVAQRLLRDWSEAFEDLHGLFALQMGKLTIAAMPSFASTMLPPLLAEYGQRYPNINITVHDIVMEDVIAAVQSGRVDLGITFEPDQLEGVQFTPFHTDRFIAVLPPSHVLLSNDKITFKQLLSHPMVALNRESSTRRWLEEMFEQQGVSPARIFDAFQLTTVGAMVASGLGVAVVPALCCDQMIALGAVCRDISGPSIERRVGVYASQRHPLSSAAQEMLSLLS